MLRRRPKLVWYAAAVVTMLGVVRAANANKPAKPAKDPSTSAVIARVIDAYGGEKALRTVHGYHASGDQWAMQRHQPIRAERWFGRPDRLRLDLAYPDHHETRITDGDRGWSGSDVDHLQPVNPFKLMAMRLQTARLDVPLRLLEQQDQVERRDNDSDGRIVLRLPIDTDLFIDYHVDPESDHITRVTTIMTNPSMVFTADYDLFHEVDGILVPFKETTYAGSTETSRFQVTRFDWNPKDLDAQLRPGARRHD